MGYRKPFQIVHVFISFISSQRRGAETAALAEDACLIQAFKNKDFALC